MEEKFIKISSVLAPNLKHKGILRNKNSITSKICKLGFAKLNLPHLGGYQFKPGHQNPQGFAVPFYLSRFMWVASY
jgi:hypothetical protein